MRMSPLQRCMPVILFFISLSGWTQTTPQEKADYTKLLWDSNLPDELYEFYNKNEIRTAYEINKEINPFYLRGDFDGDKRTDYALAIIETQTNKKGILIYHKSTNKHFVAGAGTSILNGHGDDFSWMDTWKVSDSKKIEQVIDELKKIKLKGEAILVQKFESSSGLIYWNGNEYCWLQQGD